MASSTPVPGVPKDVTFERLDGFPFDVEGVTEGEELIDDGGLTEGEVSKKTRTFKTAPIDSTITKKKTQGKRAVSDDDGSSQGEEKRLKSHGGENKSMETAKTDEHTGRTMEDFINTIDDAIREHRIDEKKTARLRECLQSGDWSEIAYTLLCEQIPLKRKGKGYSCRVCKAPKKGHTCPFCHVCSTPESKFKKDEEHVCFNCPTCFEFGKKNKKLIQVKCEGHVCPHGDPV